MASPALFIVPVESPPAPPDLEPVAWLDQVQAAHAAALHELSDLESRIYEKGEPCLMLLFRQAERRVNVLTAQLAEELARVGVSR